MSRAELDAQLVAVEMAVAAAVAGELDDGLREQAFREAHKLAGSTGTLGSVTASKRAREPEIGLGAGAPEPPARRDSWTPYGTGLPPPALRNRRRH